MNTRTFVVAALGCAMALAALPAMAQGQAEGPPHTANAKVELRALARPLAHEFVALVQGSDAPRWIGYAVPKIPGDRVVCCGSYNGDWDSAQGCGRCRLEGSDDGISTTSVGTVKLEGTAQLLVLFRAENKQVGKIRLASEDCTLDAGGLALVWLTGVKPAESVALLGGFVRKADSSEREERRVSNGALTAIAFHADAAADRAMESFAAPESPEKLRRETVFWLGAARGKAGVAVLKRLARSDPSAHVRDQVAFAFSISHEPEAVDEMIRMAHEDESGHVRSQALFWLAQKAGKKAAGAIAGAIDNDPDTGVKKQAVFALSQLPKDEGVPKLIEVARTNKNPAVRKQAMFWLGQSNDPRALKFFEDVLLH
jgi:hypothetical protein